MFPRVHKPEQKDQFQLPGGNTGCHLPGIKHNGNNFIVGGGAVPSLPDFGKEHRRCGQCAVKNSLSFGDKTTDDYNGTDFGGQRTGGL